MAQETGFDHVLARTCSQGPNGKPTLGCKDACTLAAQFAMPVEAFGRLCNERGIKIVHCQLGCFA